MYTWYKKDHTLIIVQPSAGCRRISPSLYAAQRYPEMVGRKSVVSYSDTDAGQYEKCGPLLIQYMEFNSKHFNLNTDLGR